MTFPTPESDGWHWVRLGDDIFPAYYQKPLWFVHPPTSPPPSFTPDETMRMFHYIAPAHPPKEDKPHE